MARFKWDFLQLTGVFPRTVWLSGQTLQWNISVFPISWTDLVSVSTECVFVETVFCNIMQSFNQGSKQSTFYKEILPLELWLYGTGKPWLKLMERSSVMWCRCQLQSYCCLPLSSGVWQPVRDVQNNWYNCVLINCFAPPIVYHWAGLGWAGLGWLGCGDVGGQNMRQQWPRWSCCGGGDTTWDTHRALGVGNWYLRLYLTFDFGFNYTLYLKCGGWECQSYSNSNPIHCQL